ncbi:MAG: hypothetical protein D6692_07345 [Planctomycetota bacterium]|nr:MAG: hypothetical protein D6692_07345 [Planctomycetota bacterium]
MRRTAPIAPITLLAIAGLTALPAVTTPAHAAARVVDDWARENKVANLRALSQRITLDVTDQPVEDIFRFIAEVTGADLEPIYLDDDRLEGIDPETTLTFKATNTPALLVLERLLSRVESKEKPASGYTWQFSDTGSIECGPKSILNQRQTTELYDISELLFVIPNFDNAPPFDLSTSLQQSQGGGGGQSPFQGAQDDDDDEPLEDRVTRIIDLIQANIEPDEWTSLGGSGGSITTFGTSLVVTAPDYIHRQINGYDFWPSRLHRAGRSGVQVRPDDRISGQRKP